MKHRILTATLCLALGLSQALAQDIAGTYYGSKDVLGIGKTNVFQLTYNAADATLSITYDGLAAPVVGNTEFYTKEAVLAGQLYAFKLTSNAFNAEQIVQIEPGVFVIAPATYSADQYCSGAKRAEATAGSKGGKVYENESIKREFIIGKDENRVKALASNQAEFERLLAAAVIKRCEVISAQIAAKNPPPAEGMRNATLQAEALQLIKDWATARRWSETPVRAYIKSVEWGIIRNRNTGIITGRDLVCVVIYSKNSKCGWREFVIKQEYDGANYGRSFMVGENQAAYPVACN